MSGSSGRLRRWRPSSKSGTRISADPSARCSSTATTTWTTRSPGRNPCGSGSLLSSSFRRCYQAPRHPSPEPLDSAILFAPVGTLVPPGLAALDRGGTLAVAGIYLTDIPALNYQAHLFQERTLRSVTSNTRGDAEEFLRLAERLRLRVTVTPYPFDQADQALADLAAAR